VFATKPHRVSGGGADTSADLGSSSSYSIEVCCRRVLYGSDESPDRLIASGAVWSICVEGRSGRRVPRERRSSEG